MRNKLKSSRRVFKTRWFAKRAGKSQISDAELCEAIEEVRKGQCDDLGGGVFKKRLNRNIHRSIILANSGQLWTYEYLYAKKDRANIDSDELLAFRRIAKDYAGLSKHQLDVLIKDGDLVEICHGRQT